MTITTTGEHKIVQQIVHQLEKLVDVIEVEDLTFASFVERELALVKITAPPEKRAEITQVANIFNGKIVDISDKTLTLEITGGCNKVNAAITTLRPFGLLEVARSGTLAMQREFKSAVKIRI
jgi:acetolactate synthase-1/3 small subunit